MTAFIPWSPREQRVTVTIAEAQQIVGVSRRTIYNWLTEGKLDYVRTAGGSIRIYQDSLWQRAEAERPS